MVLGIKEGLVECVTVCVKSVVILRLVVTNVQNSVNVVCERPRTWRLTATKVCPVAEKERLGGELLKAFTLQ